MKNFLDFYQIFPNKIMRHNMISLGIEHFLSEFENFISVQNHIFDFYDAVLHDFEFPALLKETWHNYLQKKGTKLSVNIISDYRNSVHSCHNLANSLMKSFAPGTSS